MARIDKTKPVLVTGATGYVAGWLVKKLLEEGISVHAAVREPCKKSKTAHLDKLAKESKGSIRYFAADLLQKGSYAEAMEGCELVYHTASPFSLEVDDPQKDLVEPALQGTRNVLEQANKTPSVKRVVLTSSCAAIYGDNADLNDIPDKMFTEKHWNKTSSLKHQPYSYSKTLAEKEAWEICKKQGGWDMVVINPSLVMGPALNISAVTSESFKLITQLGDGTMKSGVPDVGMGLVDVREVAEAHYKAGFKPEANGRNIISAHNSSFTEMAEMLHKKYGKDYPVPKKKLPKFLVWLIGPMTNKALTRKYVGRNVGHPFMADNSKARGELGLTYRPLEETLYDTFQQLIDHDVV